MRQSRNAGQWDVRHVLATAIVFSLAVIVFAGCASTGLRMAGQAMRDGDWAEAVRLLTAETTTDPTNAEAHARLGEAQYHLGRYDDAELSLQRALDLKPWLYTAHLYLGYIAEARGDLDAAIARYRYFLDRKPNARQAREVARRAEMLRQQAAQEFAREAVANEQQLMPAAFPDSTIGVVYFRADHLPDSLRPLSKGLAAMTVTDLSKVRALRVVERLKTDKLLEELGLSNSAAFDTAAAPRYGKLLGASTVLGGDVSLVGHDRLSLAPALVSSKTGEVTLPDDQTGALLDFFRLQKQLVFDVVDHLGITLSEVERDSIGRVPTQSLEAFLAYSRGLDLQDRGMYEAANDQFDRAVQIDPDFIEARDLERQTSLLGDAGIDQPLPLETFSTNTMYPTEWSQLAVLGTASHLETLLNQTGLIRTAAGADEATDDRPYTPPMGEEEPAEVIIHGRFDQ
ncbi:MAG: hypothetical protein Kow0074_12470 [Candidatus Zixiibacteriota bacterium]